MIDGPSANGNCPKCGLRDLDPETDFDGECAYCAHYGEIDNDELMLEALTSLRVPPGYFYGQNTDSPHPAV